MTKLIILDKDGTLTEPASSNTFVQSPTDQKLLPGVADRIAELAASGATLVIASNQGGVAAGHKSLEDAIAEMRYCMELLPVIQCAYFCPDFEGNTCWKVTQRGDRCWDKAGEFRGLYRKPQCGMISQAIADYYDYWLEEPEALMVGDRPEDSQAAAAAGVRFLDAAEWRLGALVQQ